MVFLEKTRMLSEYWRRRLNPYEAPGAGGEEADEVEEAEAGGSILKDVLVWVGWAFVLLVLIAVVVLLFGYILG